MKFRLLAAAIAASVSFSAFAATESFEFDATHTYPSFEVSHFGFSLVRGLFKDSHGTLTLDRDAKTGSVDVIIEAKSIETGFAKRDDHLRSKDFFNVAEFPTLTFKAANFKFDGSNPVEAVGDLTMLGVTKPVTLKINPLKCGDRMDKKYVCGADVTALIKRSDWGMKTYVPSIGDDIKITIEAEAMRK